jgi:hypothetical protein
MLLGMIGLVILMVFLVDSHATIEEEMLYPSYYQTYHVMVMRQWLKLFLPFFVILIVMDHDHPYHKVLIAYFGRFHLNISKVIFYLLILFFFYLTFFMLYHIVFLLGTTYYTLDLNAHLYFLSLYLDASLMMCLVLTFIKDKYKSLSLLLPLGYMFLSIMLEDYPNLIYFYIFPIESPLFHALTLAYPYKICYILIGLWLLNKKVAHESIL